MLFGFSLAGLVGIGSLYSSTEDLEGRIKRTAVNSNLSGNNITLNANNNIHVVGVDIQADNSISGNAKDINIQNANNTDTNYSKHCFVSWSSYHHCLLLDRWCFAG
jgi:hypothetical protein